ncbi:MAG: adenylate/guanylate cyclase domain-containing protein [Nonlabens sp.]
MKRATFFFLNHSLAYVFIGFCCLCTSRLAAQDVDLEELKTQVKKENIALEEKLILLSDIAYYEESPDSIFFYSAEILKLADTTNYKSFYLEALTTRGSAHSMQSNLTEALQDYFKVMRLTDPDDRLGIASLQLSIADAYSNLGNTITAIDYYRRAIPVFEDEDEIFSLATAEYNLADNYYRQSTLDSAFFYFKKADKMFFDLGPDYEIYRDYINGSLGLIYAQQDKNKLAEEFLNTSIDSLLSKGDLYTASEFLNGASELYLDLGKNKKALNYARRGLEIAQDYGIKEQIADSYLRISELYETRENPRKALQYFKDHIIYRDSVSNVTKAQDVANQNTQYQVSLKQKDIDILNQQKELQQKDIELQNKAIQTQRIVVVGIAIALALAGLLAFSLFKRFKLQKKTNKIIESEKERSDNLLKNILPEETAEELKEYGSVKAKRFDSVSVLFTDFKGFTSASEKLTPEQVVESIDYYFSAFDAIVEKYDLEKIKTVGDAYMCAGGLPFPTQDHFYKMTLAGLEMARFVQEAKNRDSELATFDIRIGINTGSVVAGVVGTKKFVYDIWGDTVNVASRMESSGGVGRVNLSESTYNKLQEYDQFVFEPRGAIEAKGKGKINMYFVDFNETTATIV